MAEREYGSSLQELASNRPVRGFSFISVDHVLRVCPGCGVRMRFRRVVFGWGSIFYCRRNHRYECDGDKTPILQQRHEARGQKGNGNE